MNPLAATFQRFATEECHGSSSLYERLAHAVACDDDLLDIASHGRTPIPNLFFAAVHYLVRRDRPSPLHRHYVSNTADPVPDFRNFCLERRQEIIALESNRLVQTNEIRRCGYLIPAFNFVYQRTPRPLALVEIGASAGLNLCFDRYFHTYSSGQTFGDASSGVHLNHEIRGDITPPIPTAALPIAYRIGIDLTPILPHNQDAIAWLQALIWPEHTERRTQLQLALKIVAVNPPTLIAADATTVITQVIRELSTDVTTCIFQTHTFNQFTLQARTQFVQNLREIARTREIYVLSRHDQLMLHHYSAHAPSSQRLASCDGHGRWFEWLATP
jgi:hypothetical protein